MIIVIYRDGKLFEATYTSNRAEGIFLLNALVALHQDVRWCPVENASNEMLIMALKNLEK